MRIDEAKCYLYPNYDALKSYFDTLNKEEIIFEDSSALYEACRVIVSEKFGSESENKDLYHENLINLYALMQAVEPL